MNSRLLLRAFRVLCLLGLPASLSVGRADEAAPVRNFTATGVVRELRPLDHEVVIRHQAVSNYMAAMTMPFKVKDTNVLAGLQPGDQVNFQLHVAEEESWVDGIVKIAGAAGPVPAPQPAPKAVSSPMRALLDYKFTNELGQAVSIHDFRGQALAITFFYTRCPLPDYCLRLSKNFEIASQKLATLANGPTNWHFLSVSFDPGFDSPAMLQAYGRTYHYDPAHWSLITGPVDKIAALARGSGVTYQLEDGAINHNFRTLIVDANGHLQMVFPTTGDLSDQIVTEMLKAAAVPVASMAAAP